MVTISMGPTVWNGYITHGPNGAEWLQYPWAQRCGMVTIPMGPQVYYQLYWTIGGCWDSCLAKSHSVVLNMFYLILANSTRARVQSPVSVIFIFEISNQGWPISMAQENIRVQPTRSEWLQYNFGWRRVARVVRKIVKLGGPSGMGHFHWKVWYIIFSVWISRI